MKRGLYFTYFYLPVLVPRSIVGYKHLENSSYSYDVFCKKINNRELDNTIKHTSHVDIYRDKHDSGSFQKIWWIIDAVMFYMSKKSSYSFVMTSYMPLYSLIPGLLIKVFNNKIKWASYYSDPPGISLEKNISTFKKIFLLFEKKIASISYIMADLLIFTNKEQLDFCLYGKSQKILNKAKILSHSYMSDMYDYSIKKSGDGIIRVSHFGRLYGKRNAIELIKAVDKMRNINDDLVRRFRFEFYGSVSQDQTDLIKKLGLSDYFFIHDFIRYKESLNKMVESDFLILIDSCFEKNIFFPSKLADYLGSNTPIIAVTSEGTTQRIIQETGNYCCTDSADEIYKLLLKIIKKNKKNVSINYKYSSKNVSILLDTYIQGMDI